MKRLILLCSVIVMIITNGVAFAGNSPTEKLLLILRKNNTITQEQYEELMESEAGEEQESEKKGYRNLKIKTKGGLKVSTADKKYAFEIGGRLFIDGSVSNEDKNKIGDGTELRRARISMEGTLQSNFEYELEFDIADGDADVKDAYVSLLGLRPLKIKIGQFKETFSLEELTSSKYLTFMERGLINEFVPGRNIGITAYLHGQLWAAAVGFFGEAYDADVDNEGDEGFGGSSRIVVTPFRSDIRLLHLGAAVSYRALNDEKEIKFNARPESHITDIKYVDTGNISDADHTLIQGLEVAVVYGPVSLQGEYIQAEVFRDKSLEEIRFDGYYLLGSWFLTGESRRYVFPKGAFGRIKPTNSFGALELALRYSVIDLSHKQISGGQEKNITLGLNWYLNNQARLMINYIAIDNDDDANADGDLNGNDDPKIFQSRFQIDF